MSWNRIVTVLIPLPLTYNADDRGHRRKIEQTKFTETAKEISLRFGGGMLHRFTRGARVGYWWDKGILHEDVQAAIEVDIPDNSEARAWLESYARDVLLPRFKQEAIYLKLLPTVEVMVVVARAP